MPKDNGSRRRASITPYISAAALEPRTRPIKVLWLGEMTSTLSAIIAGRESVVAAEIGRPARLTMFNVLPYIKTSMPRHIPWTMFPVVSEPFFEFKAVVSRYRNDRDQIIFPDPGEGCVEVGDIVERYEGFAVEPDSYFDGPLGTNAHLLKLGYLLEQFATDNQPVYVRARGWTEPETETIFLGGDENFPIEHTRDRYNQTTAGEITRRERPYAVLMYSYAVNFTAIAMKALRAARHDADKPEIIDHIDQVGERKKRKNWKRPAHKADYEHYWRIFDHVSESWDTFNDGLVPEGLDHPLALQMLYALRRSGPISCEPYLNSWDGHHHLLDGLLPSLPDRNRPSWVGTGKYAPMDFGDSKRIEAALIATGLVDIDQQHLTVSLSPIGEKFLDYLHPACEDPDVILRWMGDDGFFKPDSEDSVEDWLTKFFSKMKTKVNQIPGPLTEFRRCGDGDFLFDEDDEESEPSFLAARKR